jgi:hypothetical protein
VGQQGFDHDSFCHPAKVPADRSPRATPLLLIWPLIFIVAPVFVFAAMLDGVAVERA